MFDNKIAWYENTDGAGTFGAQQVISTSTIWAQSVFAADVDGDGDLDVLSASLSDDKIAWYENTDGAGTFGAQQVISTAGNGAKSVFAADIDGDGDMDVLAASEYDDKIAWYPNTGGGTFASPEQVISTDADEANTVFAAYIDGDGDMHVLSESVRADRSAWYENTDGAGTFGGQRVISTDADAAISVFAADVDGDGDMDALSVSSFDNKLAWYENTDGGGTFGAPQVIFSASATRPSSVFAADVDGDGDLDVLATLRNNNTIAWYENETIHRSAIFPAQSVISTIAHTATAVFAADIDGDGDIDALSASAANDKIAWYPNTGGGTFASPEQVISTATLAPTAVFAADIDGDGDMDALSAAFSQDEIAWHPNTGGGVFAARQVISTLTDLPRSVFAADIDGDGDMDVLSASFNDDEIAWYPNSGGGTFASQEVISNDADNARSVFAADIDGDGDMDVLSASIDDDKIAWYENTDGAGTFGTQQVLSTDADGAFCVSAADVDGDGDIDVLSASRWDNKVAWYENLDGAGTFASPERIISTAANRAVSVCTADVDNDGDMDVLSASANDNKIAWYENRGGQFALATLVDAPGVLASGTAASVFDITVTHNGISGEQDIELATLDLLFEETAGDALTSPEANAIIENLFVYRDDGSGALDAGDTLVATVVTLALSATGELIVPFADGDPSVAVAFEATEEFFVVVEATADGLAQTPNQFRVTHITEASSTAEDADHDILLTLEYVLNVATAGTLLGAGEAEIDVTPLSLSLTAQGIGVASNPESVIIANVGAGPLGFTSIGITGAASGEFSDGSPSTATLAVGATREVQITFGPVTTAGTKLAALQIASDDTDESLVSVVLSGEVNLRAADLVDALLGLISDQPSSEFDMNTDAAFDAADVVTEVNAP